MTRWLVSAAMVFACCGTAWAGKLDVGDKAPALQIDKWLKGKAVDPTKGDANTLYVVEFWATWCGPCRMSIPHLTEVQKHFAKKGNVVVIGISDEDEDVVKPFLKKWDAKMDYTVALDNDRKTGEAYMKAAGIEGIPHAFLVKQGKIVWHGHPLEMDDVLVKETKDDGWAAIAKQMQEKMEKQQEHRKDFMEAMQGEEWGDALAALDKLEKLDPSDPIVPMQRYFVLATGKKDAKAAAEVGSKLLATLDEPQALNDVAWRIMTDEPFEHARDYKFALALAKKAAELTNMKDGAILDTLALAQYENGDFATAVKTETTAVSLVKDKRMKADLARNLKKFQKAEKAGKKVEADDDDDDDKGKDDDDKD